MKNDRKKSLDLETNRQIYLALKYIERTLRQLEKGLASIEAVQEYNRLMQDIRNEFGTTVAFKKISKETIDSLIQLLERSHKRLQNTEETVCLHVTKKSLVTNLKRIIRSHETCMKNLLRISSNMETD